MKGNKSHRFQSNWKTDWLPQGFDLVRQNQDVIDGEVIENALFSDGSFHFHPLCQ